ncbi:hypothetical protein R1A27_28490 [Methylobacterium sp. NMS12]|uniref:hypothetical protein n=1 Tax=Methylobacterium sp. NMS12 TaxID=3079766 RepID=UPI003F882435
MTDKPTISADETRFLIAPAADSVYFRLSNFTLLRLKNDGTYELSGTVAEMLTAESGVVRAFGAALRDQYEAGRRGEPPPTTGRP